MVFVTALPGPLGDGCYVLAAHRPDAVSWAHPLAPDICKRIGVPLVGRHSAPRWDAYRLQVPPIASIPYVGGPVIGFPNASVPGKEWPHWTALGIPLVGSWHPDLVGAIANAGLVIANHSGPAHLACLLGKPCITIANETHWPWNPLGAHMIGGETWPSLADVQALIADCINPKKA